jgi:RHS repeat-associated protein
VTRYVHGDQTDQLFVRVSSTGTVAWYLTDRLGSVRNLTDNSGVVQDTITYDGYGNATETNSSFGDRYKFTGRELDSETGLQYNRARYYDPATGRWTSEDSLEFGAGDPNFYGYAANQPTGQTDPAGMLADSPPSPGVSESHDPWPAPGVTERRTAPPAQPLPPPAVTERRTAPPAQPLPPPAVTEGPTRPPPTVSEIPWPRGISYDPSAPAIPPPSGWLGDPPDKEWPSPSYPPSYPGQRPWPGIYDPIGGSGPFSWGHYDPSLGWPYPADYTNPRSTIWAPPSCGIGVQVRWPIRGNYPAPPPWPGFLEWITIEAPLPPQPQGPP